MGQSDDYQSLLSEQIAYYRAIANEYEQHAIAVPGEAELLAALAAFNPTGDVLELACGPGAWTERLLDHGILSLEAVDASPEMLSRAQARVGDKPVVFTQADLFAWEPTKRYDTIFHGFWISHVPLEAFDAFWRRMAEALKPGGRVFFVDDAYRTEPELVEGVASSTIERKLNDGTAFRIVKVPHAPADLEARLSALGWDARVTQTSGPFYWGECSFDRKQT